MKDSLKELAQSVLRKYPASPSESQSPLGQDRTVRLDGVQVSGPDRYERWLERWEPPRSLRVQ